MNATLVLLAGIPGAGKTETLRSIRSVDPHVRISDPEVLRTWLSTHTPWLPYPLARPFVHTIAHVVALYKVLRRGAGPLIVHDPGTRRWSRRTLLWLALLRGYSPAAVFVDVSREDALSGQQKRGRVVRHRAFDRHWQRWSSLRDRIVAGEELTPGENWPLVKLTSRESACRDVLELIDDSGIEPAADSRASVG